MPELLNGNGVIIVCLIFGVAMLVLEALTPGMGLPGVAGVVFMALGTMLMWMRHGSAAGLISLLAALALTVAAVMLSLKSAAKGRLSKSKVILHDAVASQPQDALSFLTGKSGKTLTVLSPVGEAEIDQKRFEVISEDGYIQKGARVRVLRTEGKKVFVIRQED